MNTISDVARLFRVDRNTVKKWCYEFSDYLSASATPSKGQARVFTEANIRVFALVYYYWEDEPDYEYIRILLNLEHHLEDMFVEFAYLNTPIFQEPPEELDGTWTHGILINGMSLRRPLDIARAYKTAGDALVEQALSNYPPYGLDYPIFFTYRHAIELYLKIIVGYVLDSEKEPHSLERLKRKLKEKFDVSLPDWMEARITDFHQIDPKSTTFRYAEDMPNEAKGGELWINLHQLKTVMRTLCSSFEEVIHKIYAR